MSDGIVLADRNQIIFHFSFVIREFKFEVQQIVV